MSSTLTARSIEAEKYHEAFAWVRELCFLIANAKLKKEKMPKQRASSSPRILEPLVATLVWPARDVSVIKRSALSRLRVCDEAANLHLCLVRNSTEQFDSSIRFRRRLQFWCSSIVAALGLVRYEMRQLKGDFRYSAESVFDTFRGHRSRRGRRSNPWRRRRWRCAHCGARRCAS